MSAIGFILLVIFLWFFYNLFVKVIWPVYKTTTRIKQQFKNMSGQRQNQEGPPRPDSKPQKQKVGEYIDFEEVK